MGMMEMYFHFLGHEPLFFKSWKLDTTKVVVGMSFVMGILAALYEGLKQLRDYLMLKTLEKLNESQNYSMDERTPILSDNGSLRKGKRLRFRRKPLLDHFTQTSLHMAQIAIGYILMLAVMTYNAGLFIAIVVGSGIGYFFITMFQPELEGENGLPGSVSKRSDHCS
jgi:hypothetical protein